MIFLDIANLVEFGETDLDGRPIAEYLEKIEARELGFYDLHKQDTSKIKEFAANADFDHIVVCGIGGSSLGTICLQQALTHLYKTPKLHVLDNIDPVMFTELEESIDFNKTLFIVISKSGNTPEILSQYAYFSEKAPAKNFVFITGPTGKLREAAGDRTIFEVPENVGGRFSVLTPVGLLPAALLGLDIDKMLEGAAHMREKFFSTDVTQNLPFTLAQIQHKLSKPVTVMMPYSQKLSKLSDWYSQLLAESIGKNSTTGITPQKALGVTDQHSQLQLYNEGPNDKLLIFLEVTDLGPELPIPGKPYSFNKLLKVELDATRKSLTQNKKPNLTIKINKVSEQSLGELFMLFEASIAFLGEFYNIDAFDQPGVELSKQLTREALDL